MNREIKFRVWDKAKNKYNTWFNYDRNESHDLIEYYNHPASCFLNALQDTIEDKDFVIQQFTGLKDKNGKDIYEGDILFCPTEQMMKNNTPIIYKSNYYGVVEYDAPSFRLRDIAKMSPMLWDGCEIIGNIFENPELLK